MSEFEPVFLVKHKPPLALAVETTVSGNDIRSQPNATDEYIRRELAYELAKKMLEEDLIIFEVDHSAANPIDGDIVRARAKVKIIQE